MLWHLSNNYMHSYVGYVDSRHFKHRVTLAVFGWFRDYCWTWCCRTYIFKCWVAVGWRRMWVRWENGFMAELDDREYESCVLHVVFPPTSSSPKLLQTTESPWWHNGWSSEYRPPKWKAFCFSFQLKCQNKFCVCQIFSVEEIELP